MKNANDLALETLLAVAADTNSTVPESLLRRVFELQKLHQFDTERDVSVRELQRAVEDYVSRSPSNEDSA